MDTVKYFIKAHPLVFTQDLPFLPKKLRDDFKPFFRRVLSINPYTCSGEIRCHLLVREPLNTGDFYAIEIDYLGVSYRLVYRVIETQKRVEIFSFDEHRASYHKTHERVRNSTGYKK